MEDYKMPINFVSSLVLTFAFTAFIIFIFGRESSKLNKLSFWNSICVKIALALCTAGALFNALTYSNPPWSEVILNIGLAILFTWASWFHFFHFVKPERKKTKKTKMTKYK
jgi:protein-S-isoprenylcysteine O-methyltransferase Ste14